MSNWKPADGSLIGQEIADTSTTKKATLGQRVKCKDMAATNYGMGEFIYLRGVANTAVGSVVTYGNSNTGPTEAYGTALAAANGIGSIAVAMSACVAANYGWYQIQGRAVAKVLASFAADKVPYLTATAGSLDDAVVVGDEVFSAKSLSAIDTPSTGLAEINISYPFVTDTSN